uniref:GIY-YIG domain-containing protein n=1 Tax=Octopus bimaculoides TaxID=37653 RepID=A0A0L8HNR3_OCTBM
MQGPRNLCPLKGLLLNNFFKNLCKCSVRGKNNVIRGYIGSTIDFQRRYRFHMSSFSNAKYSNSTALAYYIHDLKRRNMSYILE